MSRVAVQTFETLKEYNVHLPSRVYKMIGPVTEEAFSKFADACLVLSQSQEAFKILLNSPGGSVVDGLAIFDLICSLENKVTIQVFGEASSMGALILQAADVRQITRNARLMFHDGSIGMMEQKASDFDRLATAWKGDRANFHRILSERTGKSREYFRKKLAHDWYLTASQALEEGLVDEIT